MNITFGSLEQNISTEHNHVSLITVQGPSIVLGTGLHSRQQIKTEQKAHRAHQILAHICRKNSKNPESACQIIQRSESWPCNVTPLNSVLSSSLGADDES